MMSRPGTLLVVNKICGIKEFIHEPVSSSAKSEGYSEGSSVLKLLIYTTLSGLLPSS